MDLHTHYNLLYENAVQAIQTDKYTTDPLIDTAEDNRRGVTLVIRPDKNLAAAVNRFLTDIQLHEPEQYYQPIHDRHITLLSIITCKPGFQLNDIDVPAYTHLIQKAIEQQPAFNIVFKGITASPSCIMLQGFPENNVLTEIRNILRAAFKASGLIHSIDERYTIQTAHMTVIRFRTPLKNIRSFLSAIEPYRNFYFGTTAVKNTELVFNDWYQRKEHVQILKQFSLA